MSTTIRVTDKTKHRIDRLSNLTGRQMTELVDEAVGELEKKVFFQSLNTAFERLRADGESWSSLEDERNTEQGALGDSSG